MLEVCEETTAIWDIDGDAEQHCEVFRETDLEEELICI